MRRSPSESSKTCTMSRHITAGLFMGSWDQIPGASRKESRSQATAMKCSWHPTTAGQHNQSHAQCSCITCTQPNFLL